MVGGGATLRPAARRSHLRVEEVQLPPRALHVPRNLVPQLPVLEVLVPHARLLQGERVVVRGLLHLPLRLRDELLHEAGVLGAGAGERRLPGVALGREQAQEHLCNRGENGGDEVVCMGK